MTVDYPARFVHFGLGKCASTFLQNVWALDPAYTCVRLDDTAEGIRSLALKGPPDKLPDFHLSAQPKPNQTMIATSEGLSWGFLTSPEHQHLVPELQKMAAHLIGRAKTARTALVMVRNPLDWIRACHEQSIKEGLSDNGKDFIGKNRQLIKSVLDLRHIYKCLDPYFETIVFLSSDQLRQDPKSFWKAYETLLEAPKPKRKTFKAISANDNLANTSLKDRLQPLAMLNRQFSTIEQTWESLSDIPGFVAKERENNLPLFQKSSTWAARRVVEFAPDEDLEKICGTLTPQMEDDFCTIPIDDDLKDHLAHNYCDILEQRSQISPNLLEAYKADLNLKTCIA